MRSGGWPTVRAACCNKEVNSRTCAGCLTFRERNRVTPPSGSRASIASKSAGGLVPTKLANTMCPTAAGRDSTLSLDCSAKTAHKLALEGDKENQDGNHGHDNAGSDAAKVRSEHALQGDEPDGQGHV